MGNLGPRETRKRLIFGIVFLATGLLGGLALRFLELSPWWRLFLFLPFWLGLLGLLEARTCT